MLKDLSSREREIVNLAIEGLTDMQIARKAGIAPSTVNSYWVRIRSKLGQVSRTELVSQLLQQRAKGVREGLETRITALEEQVAQYRASAENYEEADICRAALDALPEAMLVLDPASVVLFTSAQAERIFVYPAGGMKGLLLNQLIAPPHGRTAEEIVQACLSSGKAGRVAKAMLVFAVRSDSLKFRVQLLSSSSGQGPDHVVSCLVRPLDN